MFVKITKKYSKTQLSVQKKKIAFGNAVEVQADKQILGYIKKGVLVETSAPAQISQKKNEKTVDDSKRNSI